MSEESFELPKWLLGDISFLGFNIPIRFILPSFLVFFTKLMTAYTVFQYLDLNHVQSYWMDPSQAQPLLQNLVLILNVNNYPRYTYLFLGWDSAWYLSILSKGYAFNSQSFAFFPGLIYAASLIDLVIKNPIFSILIISIFSGLLSLTILQMILENYTDEAHAIYYTLVFAFSPYIFVFSILVYAESLFLFTTLVSWLLCLKGRYTFSAIFASISAFIRPPGALLALPIFLRSLKPLTRKKVIKNFYLMILPFLGYLGAWINAWLVSGDPFGIIKVNEWNSMYSPVVFFFKIIPEYRLNSFSFPLQTLNLHTFLPIIVIFSILLPIKPIIDLFKIDKGLSLYSLTYYIGALLMGAMLSFPRYICFLFPIWIKPFQIDRILSGKYLAIYIVFSLSMAFYLWVGFLNGFFIG